jgi:hypothetical protein
VKPLRLLIIALIVVVVLGAGVLIGTPFFIRSDLSHRWINRSVGRSLRTEGSFGPISTSGMTLYSPSYAGKGKPKTHLASVQAQDVSAQFNWAALLTGALDFDQVSVKKLNVVVGTPAPDAPSEHASSHGPGFKLPSFIHGRLRVGQIEIDDTNVQWSHEDKPGTLTGTKVLATASGDKTWDLSAKGGTLAAGSWPALEIDHATGTYRSPTITLTQAKLILPAGGSLVVNGAVHLDGQHDYKLHGDLAGIPLDEFPISKWHLEGIASGSFDFIGNLDDASSGQITGTLHLDQTKFDWSFLLGKVRSLVKQLGLNDWQLDSVDMQLVHRGSHFEFSNLMLKYQDLLRVEGSGIIDSNRVNANLMIGLSPSILNWLPGVQEKVFKDERDGLCWAPMQVTGPVDNPKEDLSKRISDAISESMSKQFKNQAKSLLNDLLGQ